MKVTLTWPEIYLASTAALMMQIQNMRNGAKPRYGAPDGSWEPVFLACQAEMAAAKALNLFWSGNVGNYGSVDVGGVVDVRSRKNKWHKLILHPEDKDDLPFVLVDTEKSPTFELCGWIFARDGKQPKFWSDPAGGRPAFFVPQSALRPMNALVCIIQTRMNEACA